MRIENAWQKLKNRAGVFFDDKMPKILKGKGIQDNDQIGADVRSRCLDSGKEREKATGENRNEYATVNTQSLTEG